MKKLGFGLMRLPLLNAEDPRSVDREQVCRMVDAFLDRGFTYFDTAYMYHDFQSERIVKEVLVDRYPRDAYVLASKLPTPYLEKEGDQERIFDEQLEKCGVEFFDYYLIHTLNTRLYGIAEKFDSFGFVSRLKKEGKVRKMGFSFHDTAEVLDQILTEHPEVDFVQIQLNYLDWENERIQSRLCYETCRRHGKPIIVMEPVKGGMLAKVPERVEAMFRSVREELSVPSWAIRFAASCEGVFMVLSGMSNMQQLDDNTGYMQNFEPLSSEEAALLPRAVEIIYEDIAVGCTACRYCVPECPQKIDIPKYFSLYNAVQKKKRIDLADERAIYAETAETHGKASACVRCRKCEKICPQHIRIADAMKKVAETFEG